MKLYTFQRNPVWETIQKEGFYHPFNLFEKDKFLKEQCKEDWGFSHSYVWLKEQMLKRNVAHINHNEHLIWAWHKWYGAKSKPDKRYSAVFSFFPEPFVMMELDIDPNRILLSDYDAWHWVLNYNYLVAEGEDDAFLAKHNYYKERPLADAEADAEIRKSWENVFDLDKSREIVQSTPDHQCVQATFFEIFKKDVKKVHYFENNKCIRIEDTSS